MVKVYIFILIIIVLISCILFCFVKNRRIHTFLSHLSISQIDAINGFQFEEIIAYIFGFFGFKTTLTKKSGDYGVDVFAQKKQIKYCIQTKLYYNHSVGSSAIQQINTAKNYFECDYAVVVTNARYSKQAIIMAQKLNVLLFDRDDLKKILIKYKKKDKQFLKKYLEEKKNVS